MWGAEPVTNSMTEKTLGACRLAATLAVLLAAPVAPAGADRAPVVTAGLAAASRIVDPFRLTAETASASVLSPAATWYVNASALVPEPA